MRRQRLSRGRAQILYNPNGGASGLPLAAPRGHAAAPLLLTGYGDDNVLHRLRRHVRRAGGSDCGRPAQDRLPQIAAIVKNRPQS